MNTNRVKRIDELGAKSRSIGYNANYYTILIILVIVLISLIVLRRNCVSLIYENKFPFSPIIIALMAILLLIVSIIIIHFAGKSIYTLYDKYKNYKEETISFSTLKVYWHISLLGSIIVSFFTLYLSLSLIIEIIEEVYSFVKGNGSNLEDNIIPLIIAILLAIRALVLIPQIKLILEIQKELRFYKCIVSNKITQEIELPKIKMSKLLNNQLNKDEIIIVSLMIGVVIATILGYTFGETQYFLDNGERVYLTKDLLSSSINILEKLDKRIAFNYVLSIASFIIVSGSMYLFISRNNVKRNLDELKDKK